MARVVNLRHEPCDVYVGRAFGEYDASWWANPYRLGLDRSLMKWTIWRQNDRLEWEVITRTHSKGLAIRTTLELYRIHARRHLAHRLPELVGKRLGCWCAPGPCHADELVVLLVERKLDVRETTTQLNLFGDNT